METTLITPKIKVVNILEIKNDGSFKCPKCGTLISPDDETEETYSILDVVVDDHGFLQGLYISCICGQEIFLNLAVPDLTVEVLR